MAFLYDFYKEVEMEKKVYSFQKSLVAFTSSSPFSIPSSKILFMSLKYPLTKF